jgi:hypothetical protein
VEAISRMRRSICASAAATLIAVAVFPSPGRLDVTRSERGGAPAAERRMLVLSSRNASAAGDRGSFAASSIVAIGSSPLSPGFRPSTAGLTPR